MKLQTWLKSEVGYGEELVRSAIAGGRSAGEKALAAQPLHSVLGNSARTSLPWVTMGASLGLLASCFGHRRMSRRTAAVVGLLLGGMIGFGANVAVANRQLTEETVRGALKNVNAIRDAHWLAHNPIDYA